MKRARGFTVVELLVVVALFALVGVVFVIQKNNLETAGRDAERKADINALHYALKNVYFKEHTSYPEALTSTTLSGVDASTFTDPNEIAVNESKTENNITSASTYRYEPTGCADGKCTGYTLRGLLENEADYIKQNEN